MADHVHTERHGDVAVVRLSNPPVNALSGALRLALHDAVVALRDDPSVAAIVVAGDGRCFSGGADIGEFQRSADAGLGQGVDLNDLSALFDGCSKPVVAAIHGVAFGGGLEISLGAHARVAAPGALLGLPEVKLGVLPGAGGTQRLPRLVGLEAAASMILSGEPVDVVKAQTLGLVDAVASGADELLPAACAHALSLLGQPPRRVRDRSLPAWSDAAAASLAATRAAMPMARAHAHNGDEIVACLQAAVQQPFDAGMAFERERFLACNASPQAAALQHVFFAQREAAKVAGLPRGTAERPVRTVGIVVDGVDVDAAGQAMATEFRRARLDVRLLPAGALQDVDLAACDLVIDAAAFEPADAGAALARFRRLGAVCRAGAMLARTDISASLDAFADATGRPADVIGLGMVDPSPTMRAREVRPLDATQPEVLATVMALARRLDKVAVVVRGAGGIDAPMWAAYREAAESLLRDGMAPDVIDAALEAYGMAVGPCRASGLDADRMPRGSAATPLPPMDGAAIAAHCLGPLAEIGKALLRDGVAARASDIDMVWVFGRGYPAERGGPMYAAARAAAAST